MHVCHAALWSPDIALARLVRHSGVNNGGLTDMPVFTPSHLQRIRAPATAQYLFAG